ncbi:putative charged multivesicular body protein 4B-like protein CHMP4BP1 [Stegostoma tigrinum]|uniref:putative charged multivesicular body protein 4B-like protein CHMP4BP1 n=1 Tax=Stegostoma tigrinum TaxID=3053191 RepID=UPI002870082D|nr:putative charged multivesicular body protein 4B-like protein CHMP4BP1 [Stegostoma tigrinum]
MAPMHNNTYLHESCHSEVLQLAPDEPFGSRLLNPMTAGRCLSNLLILCILHCVAALQALKRKKRYEKQLAQIDGTLSTIEFQREALENANTNTEVLKNMGFAAKAMKAAHENMDIDKVDELMQDITEQQELAQEISEAISKPVGFGEDFDEDELMAELEELEQEELDKSLLEIGGAENVPLPNVPSTSLPATPVSAAKKKEEEDEDMRDLENWAAM